VGLGTKIGASALGDAASIAASQGPSGVAGGLRLLQAPRLFVSSLVVNKPSRIAGRLMVRPLAWVVYAVAQRRMRQQWARHHETVPNQSTPPTTSPTLRWVFQLLEGIHHVRGTVQGQVHDFIEGLNDVQLKILRLFGEHVCCLYQISPG
jgi:transposase